MLQLFLSEIHPASHLVYLGLLFVIIGSDLNPLIKNRTTGNYLMAFGLNIQGAAFLYMGCIAFKYHVLIFLAYTFIATICFVMTKKMIQSNTFT